jgi:hypothetical protein
MNEIPKKLKTQNFGATMYFTRTFNFKTEL